MDHADTDEAASNDAVRHAHAPLATNDRRRLHGSIAHTIAVAIIGGEYQPGHILPNEDVASERLSVSRSAYREAVRILAAKGLLESRPKTGTKVRERSNWNFIDPDVLAWHFEVEPSESFITQLFELRQLVEPSAAALAAARRGEAHLAAMRDALARMADETLASESGLQADLDFHHTILMATLNEPLTVLSSGIGATIRWSTKLKVGGFGPLLRDPIPEHTAVYDAIAARDAPAARAAMEHLLSLALEDLWNSLRTSRNPIKA